MTVRIAEPCHASWDAMTPRSEGRHCASCDQTVVDLTGLEPAVATRMLERDLPARIARGERVCIRTRGDRRGRLLRPTQRLLTNGLAAVLAMTMAGALGDGSLIGAEEAGAPPAGEEPKVEVPLDPLIQPVMGAMVCMPEVPEGIASVTVGEQATSLPQDTSARLVELLGQADGKWKQEVALPRIAPSHVLTYHDGSSISVILGRYVQGPRGVIDDADLVKALLNELSRPDA